MDILKVASYVTGAGAFLSSLYVGITFTNERLHEIAEMHSSIRQLQGDAVLTNMRIDIRQATERLWKITDRYGDDLFEAPSLVREEARAVKTTLEALQQEYKAVQHTYQNRDSDVGYYAKYYERHTTDKPIIDEVSR